MVVYVGGTGSGVGDLFYSRPITRSTQLHTFEGGKQFPGTLCMGLWVIEGEHIFFC